MYKYEYLSLVYSTFWLHHFEIFSRLFDSPTAAMLKFMFDKTLKKLLMSIKDEYIFLICFQNVFSF